MFGERQQHVRQRNLLAISLLTLVTWFLIPVSNSAEVSTLDEFKAFGEKFDHLTTGFALTGEHRQLDCGECHIGGVFETLPRECDACHDNVIAAGKTSNHIQTTQPCDVCHNTGAFLVTAIMDHSITEGNCASCHNGISATGKGPAHIASTDACDACHTVNFWIPAIAVDHDQVIDLRAQLGQRVIQFLGAIDFHIKVGGEKPAGVIATGKTPNHISTTNSCEACHFSTGDAWLPVLQVNHAHVIGACSSCHDLPQGHIPIQQECNACHGVPPVEWTDVSQITQINSAPVQNQSSATIGTTP